MPRLVRRMHAIGVVKSFNPSKGWGFITWEGADVFVHGKDCIDGAPVPGDAVCFEMDSDPVRVGQKKAMNVTGCTGQKDPNMGKGNSWATFGKKKGATGCQGEVKNFDEEKGFGFIIYESQDVFFHVKDCKGKCPQKWDWLTFDLIDDQVRAGQLKALNVTGGTGRLSVDEWQPPKPVEVGGPVQPRPGFGAKLEENWWNKGKGPSPYGPGEGGTVKPRPGFGTKLDDNWWNKGQEGKGLGKDSSWGPAREAPSKGGRAGPYGETGDSVPSTTSAADAEKDSIFQSLLRQVQDERQQDERKREASSGKGFQDSFGKGGCQDSSGKGGCQGSSGKGGCQDSSGKGGCQDRQPRQW